MSYSNVNLAYSLRSNYRNETPYTLEKNTYSRKMLEKYYNDTRHRPVSCLNKTSESEYNNNPDCKWWDPPPSLIPSSSPHFAPSEPGSCIHKHEHPWEN